MTWNAEIVLRSNNVVTVENLISISWKRSSDQSLIENKDFENFVLPQNRNISFIGKRKTASLNSNDIEYLSLYQII